MAIDRKSLNLEEYFLKASPDTATTFDNPPGNQGKRVGSENLHAFKVEDDLEEEDFDEEDEEEVDEDEDDEEVEDDDEDEDDEDEDEDEDLVKGARGRGGYRQF